MILLFSNFSNENDEFEARNFLVLTTGWILGFFFFNLESQYCINIKSLLYYFGGGN